VRRGQSLSDEHKAKLSKANKKSVVQLNKDNGDIIAIFDSIKGASTGTGITCQSISKVCTQNPFWDKKNQKYYTCKTAGGYKWRFATEEEISDAFPNSNEAAATA